MNSWEQMGWRLGLSALGALIVGCSSDTSPSEPVVGGAVQGPAPTTATAPPPASASAPPVDVAPSPGESGPSGALPVVAPSPDPVVSPPPSDDAPEADAGASGNDTPTPSPPVQPPAAPTFSSNRADFGLGGASLCAGGGLAVCENFEGTPLGAGAPAGFVGDGYGNRTLAVVDDDSARGERSLRIDVAGGQGAVVGMLVRANLGALGTRHFGRSFMKIQAPAPTTFVHWDAFEGRGTFGGQTNMVRWSSTGTGVGTQASNWSWIYNVQSTDHGEFGTEGSRAVHPVDGAWMCLEWFIDAGNQEARFFEDGSEVQDLHIDSERSEIPVFDQVRFGFQKFQQSAAFRVWVDEIALNGERIGCNH